MFIGGGLGAVARWALSTWVTTRAGSAFPWGTLLVNVLGCLAIGALVGWLADKHTLGPTPRLLLVTGLLGGFTTFSTFGLETWQLIEEGRGHLAASYAVASLVAGVTGVVLGLWSTRAA